MNRYRHATLVLSLVALLTFTPPVHGAYASNGAFTNFWCNITSFFGFTCDTPNEIVITEPEVSVAPPSPLPQSADYQMVNAVNETPAPNTTIVEEHNTYTTNPTTFIYQPTTDNNKISDTQFLNLFQKLTTIINQTSQQNPTISRDFFAKQVDKIYEKSNDSTDDVQDNLDTLQTNNSASFTTELLTVTGNTSIDGNTTVGGDLNVIGTITAGVLNVDALSSGGALVAPYFTATSTTATSSFMGAVGIGTTTPNSKLDVAGNINISAGSAYTYNSANVITASTTLNNYFFGGAGNLTMTGTGNTASGYQALLSNTTGLYNTANGWQALYSNTTGYSNSANGKQTLYSNATGHSNIANGVEALYSNTTGNLNIASGVSSLLSNTTGSYNVAIGTSALRLNTTGSSNTALGNSAGRYTTDGVTGNATGSNSVFLGADTKALNGNDTNQIVIGYNATGNGSNSVTLGNTSITKTVLQGNVGIGTTTPTSKLTVVGDVNIQGTATSSAVITLRDPIGNVSLELRAGTSTLLNTFVGVGAGSSNTTGTYNVANGYLSLYSNTTGTENTAVGHNSLNFNTTGSYNTAVGRNAIYANTTGNNNTANGVNALYSNTTGSENTANGVYALLSNTTGTFNNANGYMSMRFNTTGSENTANGVASLYSNITGSYNTAIGRNAGRYLTDGTSAASTTDYSLFLGYNTKALTDNDQNAIVIGYNANGIGSNTVVLGNDSIVTTALKGNVGIGTTSPTSKLTVVGDTYLGGDFNVMGGNVGIGTMFPSDPFQLVTALDVDISSQQPIASFMNSASTSCTTDDYCNESHLSLLTQRQAVSETSDTHRRYIKFGSEYNGGNRLFDWYIGANAQHRFILYSNIDNTHFFTADPNGDMTLNSGAGATKLNVNLNAGGTNGFGVYNGGSSLLFGVNSGGEVGIGGSPTTNQGLTINEFSNAIRAKYAGGPVLNLVRTDADSSITSGNLLGTISFKGIDDSEMVGAQILSYSDGSWSSTSAPGRLIFNTTPSGSTAGVEAMRINSAGNIGMASTSPSAKLTVTQSAQTATGGFWLSTSDNTDFRSQFMNTSGVLSFYGGDTAGTLNTATLNAAGEWTNASDISYKENIEKLSYGLETVLALQPRSYDIKNTDNHRIGFIAQEVEEVIPEVVSGEDGSKGISYGNLVSVAISAIQELARKVSGFADLFKSERIETNTLCVGNTCVTETELQELLQDKLEQSKSGNKSESSTNTDTSSSESPVEIEPVATSADNLSVELEGSVSEDLIVDDLEVEIVEDLIVDDLEVEIVEDLPVDEIIEENSVTDLEN